MENDQRYVQPTTVKRYSGDPSYGISFGTEPYSTKGLYSTGKGGGDKDRKVEVVMLAHVPALLNLSEEQSIY